MCLLINHPSGILHTLSFVLHEESPDELELKINLYFCAKIKMIKTDTSGLQNIPNYTGRPKMGVVHRVTWYCLLLMIFLIPWGEGVYDGLAKVVAMPTLGLSLVMLVLEGTHRNYSLFNLFAVILGVWYLVGIWWSPIPVESTDILKTYIMLILMSLMFTYLISDEYKFRGAYQAYVIGCFIATGVIFYNYLNGIEGPYYQRYTVENIETDNMAILLAFGIPMGVWLYTQARHWTVKAINLTAIPIIFYGIFLTGTRTGLVCGTIGLMYLAFTQRRASFNLKLIYVGIVIGLAVAVVSLAPKSSVERIFSIGEAVASGDLNHREVIWQHTLSVWAENPLLGSGTGALGHALNPYFLNFKWAHNSYVQILGENGIIGLAIYLMMIFSLLYYALKCQVETKFFLLTLWFTIFISQMTLHSQNLKEVWFVWSVIGVHGYYYSKKTALQRQLTAKSR